MRYIIEQLKQFRIKKKLSQTKLGKKVGLPQSHISQIESGKVDVRVSNLIELGLLVDLELMFIPRELKPAVQALLLGKPTDQPAWLPDEEDA